MNLRKIPGTPAGCPWDTRRDKQGSTGRCPRDFPVIYCRKTDRRAFLPGHRPGVPGTPGHPGGVQKIYVIFSYVPFLLPRKRCDFEIAKTLRFAIADEKNAAIFFDLRSGHLKLDFFFLPETGKQIWHHQWPFSSTKNVAILNLRFHNAAICDFIPRFFCDFFAELAANVAILILRFENASDCDCDFLGR